GRSAVRGRICVLANDHVRGNGIVVSRADEERAALGIDRRWLPYRAPAVLVRPPTVVGHGEGLPKHRTALSIERHYTSAKAATRIRGVRSQTFFVRRDADVNHAVENNRRSSNDGGGMSLHVRYPSESSCLPVYCDYICAIVRFAGTKNVSNDYLIRIDCGTDTRNSSDNAIVIRDLVRPNETAGLLLDGEEIATPIGEVNGVTIHGWSGRNVTTRGEYPLRCQTLDVGGGNGMLCRLAPGVVQILSRDSPLARAGQICLALRAYPRHQQ